PLPPESPGTRPGPAGRRLGQGAGTGSLFGDAGNFSPVVAGRGKVVGLVYLRPEVPDLAVLARQLCPEPTAGRPGVRRKARPAVALAHLGRSRSRSGSEYRRGELVGRQRTRKGPGRPLSSAQAEFCRGLPLVSASRARPAPASAAESRAGA